MSIKCKGCGMELDDDTKFCTECGAKQDVLERCPNCGKEIKFGSKFCTECGEKAGDETPQISIPDFETLRKNKRGSSKWVPIIGVCVAVVAFLIFWGSSNNEAPKKSSPVITIKAEELVDDYIRDQVSAEKKYKGKEMRITGVLLRKNQFANSQNYALYIYRNFAAGKEYSVSIDVPQESVSLVNKVNIGDFVNAEGECVGIVPQKDPTDISIQIYSTKVN